MEMILVTADIENQKGCEANEIRFVLINQNCSEIYLGEAERGSRYRGSGAHESKN